MSLMKVLYFMPQNPLENNSGSRTRTRQLLEYFNSRADKIQLHYVGVGDWTSWSGNYEPEFKRVFDKCSASLIYRRMPKKGLGRFFNYTIPNLIRKIKLRKQRKALPDLSTAFLKKQFNNLLKQEKYDTVIMSYTDWSSIVEDNPLLQGVNLIIDTHDFITAQYAEKPGFDIGKGFKREMEILSNFDEIWSLSADEGYLFSQFVKVRHQFVPSMFQKKYRNEANAKTSKYDLIYVASDNPHNLKAADWFFQKVYPLLSSNIKICVIGVICDHIPALHNVDKITFAKNLDEYYHQSKVSICPMLSGTGIKIKVVEALSFGLPVVCNFRGLDGLPVKFNNGCLLGDAPDEFADHILHLLSDQDFYTQIRALGISMFNDFFEKEKCYQHLDKVLNLQKNSTNSNAKQ